MVITTLGSIEIALDVSDHVLSKLNLVVIDILNAGFDSLRPIEIISVHVNHQNYDFFIVNTPSTSNNAPLMYCAYGAGSTARYAQIDKMVVRDNIRVIVIQKYLNPLVLNRPTDMLPSTRGKHGSRVDSTASSDISRDSRYRYLKHYQIENILCSDKSNYQIESKCQQNRNESNQRNAESVIGGIKLVFEDTKIAVFGIHTKSEIKNLEPST